MHFLTHNPQKTEDLFLLKVLGFLTEDFELGSCCVCEGCENVRNIVQLDYKVQSESAWGCVVCGLASEGAVAAVCDGCMEKYAQDDIDPHIRFLMDTAKRRIPVAPESERIPHEHDMQYH